MSREKQNLELRKIWKSRLEEWARTNLSQVDYCRKHDLKKHQFTYWKRKFEKETLPSIEFVEIPKESPVPLHINHEPLKLAISSRFTIEIPDDFDTDTLKRVLQILEGE